MSGIRGEVELVVLPDPIAEPLAPIVELGPLQFGAERYPVGSIDVVDWRGDLAAGNYSFWALSTDVDHVFSACAFQIIGPPLEVCQYWATNLRRIDYAGGTVNARAPYADVRGEGNFSIHGLTMWSTSTNYLLWDTSQDPDRWAIYQTSSYGNPGSEVAGYTTALTDRARDPHRNRVGPGNYFHVPSGDPPEARGNFLGLRANGDVQARRPGEASGALGTGGPDGAAFFEVGVGEIYWVDAGDPRTLYESPTYGTNPIRLRYAVDTSLPIFPARASDGDPGEPYVIYHTSGVTRGVVLVYRDENAPGTCAE